MWRIPGFVDASILRRATPDGVEFLIVTRWESMAAVRAFAGEPTDTAVMPDAVLAMMVDYDRVVRRRARSRAAVKGDDASARDDAGAGTVSAKAGPASSVEVDSSTPIARDGRPR